MIPNRSSLSFKSIFRILLLRSYQNLASQISRCAVDLYILILFVWQNLHFLKINIFFLFMKQNQKWNFHKLSSLITVDVIQVCLRINDFVPWYFRILLFIALHIFLYFVILSFYTAISPLSLLCHRLTKSQVFMIAKIYLP